MSRRREFLPIAKQQQAKFPLERTLIIRRDLIKKIVDVLLAMRDVHYFKWKQKFFLIHVIRQVIFSNIMRARHTTFVVFVENGFFHLRLNEQIKILPKPKSELVAADIGRYEEFTHSQCVFFVEFVKILLYRLQYCLCGPAREEMISITPL